jgi:hypothetical protein
VSLRGPCAPELLSGFEGVVGTPLGREARTPDIYMAAVVSFLIKLEPGEGIVTGLRELVTGG